MDDGFALNSGLKVTGAGVLLIGGEAFKWRPWVREGMKEGTIGAGASGNDEKGVKSPGGKLQNAKGQLDIDEHAWGIIDLAWPKPDLLILGTGRSIVPLSPETRRHVNALGVRIEVQDTRNAAAQFNMLATERGVQQVAAALVPIGWREGSWAYHALHPAQREEQCQKAISMLNRCGMMPPLLSFWVTIANHVVGLLSGLSMAHAVAYITIKQWYGQSIPARVYLTSTIDPCW